VVLVLCELLLSSDRERRVLVEGLWVVGLRRRLAAVVVRLRSSTASRLQVCSGRRTNSGWHQMG
jgi:hypothetical protein